MTASGLYPGAPDPGPKRFRHDTERTCAPAETFARLSPLLRPLGVTRVANVTGLDILGIPVVTVCRPNARSLSVAQGKGVTLEQARVSGVMESLELFHAERPVLELRLATWHDLTLSAPVADVWGIDRPRPGRFHEHFRILWVEGFDLVSGGPMWLPFEVVHMDCTVPFPSGSGAFYLNSNGLASGNHILEAISQAVCELVERDSYAHWYGLDEAARLRTRIEPDTVADPVARSLLDRLEEADFGVVLWNLTSPVGVATVRADIWSRKPRAGGIVAPSTGMGCHPARSIALVRALTEAAQSRVTWISGARDDLFADDFERMRSRDHVPDELPGADGSAARPFTTVPDQHFETFEDEVRWLGERLEASGLDQVIVTDLTRPGLGISVVRATVPGLRHPRPTRVSPARGDVHAVVSRGGR